MVRPPHKRQPHRCSRQKVRSLYRKWRFHHLLVSAPSDNQQLPNLSVGCAIEAPLTKSEAIPFYHNYCRILSAASSSPLSSPQSHWPTIPASGITRQAARLSVKPRPRQSRVRKSCGPLGKPWVGRMRWTWSVHVLSGIESKWLWRRVGWLRLG